MQASEIIKKSRNTIKDAKEVIRKNWNTSAANVQSEDLKCENCGGTLMISQGGMMGICDSCGCQRKLNLTQKQKNEIAEQIQIINERLHSIQSEKDVCKSELECCNDLPFKRKNIRKGLFLSALPIIPFLIAGVFTGREPFFTIAACLWGLAYVLGIIMGSMFLSKGTDVFKGRKARTFIIGFFQYLTLCIYGIAIGVQALSNFSKTAENAQSTQIQLTERINEIEKEEKGLKIQLEYLGG